MIAKGKKKPWTLANLKVCCKVSEKKTNKNIEEINKELDQRKTKKIVKLI